MPKKDKAPSSSSSRAPARPASGPAYWLFKTEAEEHSWEMQKARGKKGEPWTGVRNFVARNNMKAMQLGDLGFFYHTGDEKQIVGIVEVCALAHPGREGRHRRLEVRRRARRVRHAQARHAGGRQGQPEARRHGAGAHRAAVGAAGDAGGVERGVPHGRPRSQDDRVRQSDESPIETGQTRGMKHE